MVKTCLGLLAGMLTMQLSSFAVAGEHLDLLFTIAVALLFVHQWQLFAGVVCGAVLFSIAAEDQVQVRIPHNIEGDSIVVSFEVLDFAVRRNASHTFLARPLDDERLPQRVRLSWFAPQQVPQLGEQWQLEVRLRRPRGSRNPGGFDFEAWLFREGVAAAGYVVDGKRSKRIAAAELDTVQRIRARFSDRVVNVLGETEPASVLIAIVVGARHLISAEQWQRYAATGTSHLMAISGLHIGLAAIGAYFVARVLSGALLHRAARCNHHLIAIAAALLLAALYVQISGMALPARRAGLMLGMAALFVLIRRVPDTKVTIGSAAIAIAVASPLATMSPGFALSFAAVVTLIWVSRRRRVRLSTLQLSLLFALMPLTIVYFDRASLVALPVNLVAVPLFSLVTVPLALVGFLLDGPLHTAGDLLLMAASKSVLLLEYLLQAAESLPWASFPIASIEGGAGVLLVLPLVWAVLPPRWPGRALAWLGLLGLLVLTPEPPQADCAQITVLDVGQGLSVAVQTHSKFVLYDTGPAYRGGGSAVQNVVLPFLRSRRIRRIDKLIVSHADLDHAGAVERLFDAVAIGSVLAGEPLPRVASQPCLAGDSWSYDGVEFSVLQPADEVRFAGNDQSCVVLIEVGDYRILLTGDIEKAAEYALLRDVELPSVHVVTVPHHGSRTSSSAAFTRALKPSFAIVSSAYGNHWGFPKNDVVGRWHEAGAELINTATAGAVEMRVCAASGFTSISAYRAVKRRIWHE